MLVFAHIWLEQGAQRPVHSGGYIRVHSIFYENKEVFFKSLDSFSFHSGPGSKFFSISHLHASAIGAFKSSVISDR
jgi:hypothetical protein